jgi:CRP-like cAMP-binding protein
MLLCAQLVYFDEATPVFDVGDPSDRIWFLKEGCLVLDAPFGRLTLDKPGEVVGEVCTFRNVPRTHAARTVTETSMYALLKRDIEEVFELGWLAVAHAARTALRALHCTRAHAQVFKRHPLELQVVLRMVKKSPSELDDDFVDYMGCTTAQVGKPTRRGCGRPAQLRPTRTSG